MWIRSWIFVFLRPAYHGGKQRIERPGSREKEIEFERYPSFQKRDAQALRFGSMNSITFLDAKNDDEEARMCWVNCSSRVGVKFDGSDRRITMV